jgi:phosphate transport system protein
MRRCHAGAVSTQPNPATVLIGGTDSQADVIRAMAMRACTLARTAAAAAADALATGRPQLYDTVAQCERELDLIDRDMDDSIVFAISSTTIKETRELLACLKFVIDLERIGDLVSSFASRTAIVREKIDPDDLSSFIKMATLLEQMLAGAERAFLQRDLNAAIHVLRADAEIDRLRNLIFMRHVEDRGQQGDPARESVQVLFMAHALERAGDHAKNLGEEVCHFVSGRTVRHVLRSQDKPYEQLFIDWLRDKQSSSR